MEFDVFEWAEGGNNEFIHHLPGRAALPVPAALNGGMTESTALQEWFWKTREQGRAQGGHDRAARPRTGESKRSWTFADAFPIKWTGPRIAASAGGMGDRVPSRSPTPG